MAPQQLSDASSPRTSSSSTVQENPLDDVINAITQDMSRKAFRTRLKALAGISPANATTICDHILAEKIEGNIKPSTAENKVKALIWLTRYLRLKPFEHTEHIKQSIVGLYSFLH